MKSSIVFLWNPQQFRRLKKGFISFYRALCTSWENKKDPYIFYESFCAPDYYQRSFLNLFWVSGKRKAGSVGLRVVSLHCYHLHPIFSSPSIIMTQNKEYLPISTYNINAGKKYQRLLCYKRKILIYIRVINHPDFTAKSREKHRKVSLFHLSFILKW
jgi:hypothetical protein